MDLWIGNNKRGQQTCAGPLSTPIGHHFMVWAISLGIRRLIAAALDACDVTSL